MGSKKKISVIIPVYNVEKYLRECLDSLVNQTLKDIEIICINDGSTDGSSDILEEYALKDDRIMIINQDNQGQGIARNKGIEIANGEYLAFVDPDDYIDLNTFEIVYDKFKETDADIVQYDFVTCRENGKFNKRQAIKKQTKKYLKLNLKNNQVFNLKDFKIKSFAGFRLCVWDKVYSTKFIKENNIIFAPTKYGEDNIFSISAILLAGNIIYLNKYFYHYRTRLGSAVHKASDDNFCVFENVRLLKEFMVNNNLFTEYEQAYNDYLIQVFALHYTNIPEDSIERYLEQCSENLSEDDYKKFLEETKPKFTFLQRIFSVKNHKVNGEKQKYLCVLGAIFKIRKINYKKIFSVTNEYMHHKICFLGLCIKIKMKDKNLIQKFLETDFLNFQKIHQRVLNNIKKDILHRKIRVCFLVNETSKWNLQTLYDEMENSDIFEPFVLVTTFESNQNHNNFEHTVKYFRNLCKNTQVGYNPDDNTYTDIKQFKPDIIFYQQPGKLNKNQCVQYSSEFALPYHFSYAIAETLQVINSHLSKFYIYLYKYFIFSNAEKNQYENKLNYRLQNLYVTGHPKLDIYKDYKEENYQRKYVIYAPHHSFEKTSLNYATFEWNGKYILEWAKQHPEFDWVFKPHPRFMEAVVSNNIMTAEEVEKYYSDWEKIGIFYNDGSYFDLFKNSKCLITDCGSFLIEYLLTKQPVIHLRNPKGVDYIESARIAMESYYDVWNQNELANIFEELLIKCNDTKRTHREKVISELGLNNLNATDNVMQIIKNDLGIG